MTKSDFKKGTRFIITGEPICWNSTLNANCPLRNGIKYPYRGVIEKISNGGNGDCFSDGFYGWSLSSLISEHLIEIAPIKEERKKKLTKIYNL